jgi:hypothetical protein
MKYALTVLFLLASTCLGQVRDIAPDTVIEGTLAALESDGLVHAKDVDQTKMWSKQIASQKVSRKESRKIFLVEFSLRNGETIEAIAKWDNSPMPERSGLVIYVISKTLQPDGVPTPPRYK